MMHKRVARRIALALASVAQRRDSRGTIAASAAVARSAATQLGMRIRSRVAEPGGPTAKAGERKKRTTLFTRKRVE